MPVADAGRKENTQTVRFEKRGPKSWDNFLSAPAVPLSAGGTTRLLVHAVADASSMQWIPKVRQFLEAQQRSGNDLTIPHGLDLALAQYMEWLCYGEQRSPSIGSLLFFGIICLMPEVKGKLPLAARSLKSWAKLAITVEGGPIPEEIVFLAAVELIREGHVYEGCWVLCQYDSYGREQDMEQLWGSDISWDNSTLALVFGESERGQSAKTGHNPGVVSRRAEVIDIFLALKKAAGDKKVFPIPQEKVRQRWHRIMRKWGLPFAGPLHAIRHSGPSEDLARGRSTLENVRRRGRWKSLDSVQRYTKSFALTRFRARVPAETAAQAARIAANLRASLLSALRDGNNTDSAVARLVHTSLMARRGSDNNADMETAAAARKATTRRTKIRKSKGGDETEDGDTDDDSDVIGWVTD